MWLEFLYVNPVNLVTAGLLHLPYGDIEILIGDCFLLVYPVL